MKTTPLVSLVIPTYKRADSIERALDCAINQTYDRLEVIVVDDNGRGSIEQRRTERVVSVYCLKNKVDIRYIANDINIGGALARNVGINSAHGEYIAFLDDDDEIMPNKIERQLKVFERNNSNLALVYCDVIGILPNGSSKHWNKRYRGNCLYQQLTDGCIAATSQWLCRKKSLEAVGGFSDSPSKQDSILLMKLLGEGFDIDYVPEVLSVYKQHDGKRISNTGNGLKGELRYYEYARPYFSLLTKRQRKESERCFLLRIGKEYAKAKLPLAALRCIAKAFLIKPVSTTAEVIQLIGRIVGQL